MEETDKTPMMLRFLFGERRETAPLRYGQKTLVVTLREETASQKTLAETLREETASQRLLAETLGEETASQRLLAETLGRRLLRKERSQRH